MAEIFVPVTEHDVEWAILNTTETGRWGRPVHDVDQQVGDHGFIVEPLRDCVRRILVKQDLESGELIEISDEQIEPEVARLSADGLIEMDADGFWRSTEAGKVRKQELVPLMFPSGNLEEKVRLLKALRAFRSLWDY